MQNLLKKFRKFIGFSIADQIILLKTFAVIALIRLLLNILSFQKFRKLFAKAIKTNDVTNFSHELIEHQVWAITTVSPTISAVCLPQALALKYFLREDKAVKLVIGINQNNGFAAHAWVEKEDKILIGELPNDEFQPIWDWS